ncbi:MAG: hypothetical protein O3C05_02930 [Proteobacteria bacterium]|nr:hypothetical protein [Pseudomonadota bacterium]
MLKRKFHMHGRKEFGMDCIGLIMLVAKTLNIQSKIGGAFTRYDLPHYDYMLDKQRLIEELCRHCIKRNNISIGSIALFISSSLINSAHIGIIGNYFYQRENNSTPYYSLIHACMRHNAVIEHRLINTCKDTKVEYFDFFGIS